MSVSRRGSSTPPRRSIARWPRSKRWRREAERHRRKRAPTMVTLAAALALVALSPAAPADAGAAPADSVAAYRREVEAWRQKRLERLQADGGWLTVVGLHWLKPGATSFGAAPDNDLVLPAHSAPARAGVFTLDAGRVSVEVASGVPVTLAGRPVGKRVLATDAAGREPDILVL